MFAPPLSLPVKLAVPGLILADLAAVDATLQARMSHQPHAQLIDCGTQPCRHRLGVCYFLSELLLLRQRGASIWLCNVDAGLHRCLQLVGLGSTFCLAEQA